LNDTLTGFRHQHIENLVDKTVKHKLISLALQEYEIMSYLSKKSSFNTMDSKLKIVKLNEVARQRLELEKMIIREDPKVFL
jgi:hypothetical protein